MKRKKAKTPEYSATMDEHIPEPTILYKPGEAVRYGGWQHTRVLEVLEEGRVLKVHRMSEQEKRGKTLVDKGEVYVAWCDVSPTIPKDTKVLSYRDDLLLRFSQRDIRGVLGMYYHFGVDMEPDYQRELVWDHEDKVALIHSIYTHVDIGKFTFAHRGYSEDVMYEIVDGKQRLSALCEFYEGRFEYRGLTYHQMTVRDQSHFDNYIVSVAEIENPTREQILRLFVKLNTCGKPQDRAHLDKVREMLENA